MKDRESLTTGPRVPDGLSGPTKIGPAAAAAAAAAGPDEQVFRAAVKYRKIKTLKICETFEGKSFK